jgi:hypothetical protein
MVFSTSKRTAESKPPGAVPCTETVRWTERTSHFSLHTSCTWNETPDTYSNNRADNAYIPGAVIPGCIIIKPDFPECIDDFGFLWFEDEAVVAGSASWVVAGNAADAITKEVK